MKTLPLTIRGCPDRVHRVLKARAAANRRSLNAEALVWLEKEAQAQSVMTGREWAQRLRQARKVMSEAEHRKLGKDIETARKLMNREHLR